MSLRTAVFLLSGLLLAGRTCPGEEPAGGIALGGREAELAAGALLRENERLQAQVRELQQQVQELTEALAAARAQLDLGRDRGAAEWSAARAAGTTSAEREMRLRDADSRLRLAVVDAGRAQGVKPGMTFYVVREGRPVARLRAVEVREAIAGTTVEEIWMEPFPRKGDRVVMGAPSER